jgi:hypothetical protein
MPHHRQGCLCVHSRPDRRQDFGPALPRAVLVPFLPFLPASTVCSAEARPEGRTSTACGFVAPRSRPWGSPRFQLPPTSRWPRPEGHFEAFPSGEDPSKLFPLRQPDHLVTAPPPRGFGCVHRVAFPLVVGVVWVPCHHGSACNPTSGLCSTEESVASEKRCRFPFTRCSHGLLDRTRSDACRA